ncbi:MAG: serine/threonine protein kinase [Polyangiaceae bacterium]|nr:serine/threonine protein kinase [Polyangiaceae bacterium]
MTSAAAQPIQELTAGQKLGPYVLLCAIAQGGMARVWAARDSRDGRVVALKTIRPELAADRGFQSLFVDEARYASSVDHGGVCRVFGLGDEHGVLYIAMEWVTGESLARILKPHRDSPIQPIEPRMAARILADCCSALHAAHELQDDHGRALRLVHCDVSLQNLLVTVTGGVKLVDFGVARAQRSADGQSLPPKMDGKAAYMAPEHAAGRRISRLSDVFTLGICLYEVTTGVRPFSAGSWDATIERLLAGDFRPPSELVADYPPELERILLRAMALSPAHRYPSALRMRAALEEWLRASGTPLGGKHVSEFLHERVGAVIAERENHIRGLVRG